VRIARGFVMGVVGLSDPDPVPNPSELGDPGHAADDDDCDRQA
jgi:hypothetical protein